MKKILGSLIVAAGWAAMSWLTAGVAVAGGSNEPRTFQVEEMTPLGGGAIGPQGAAWLKRSRNGIEGRVMVNVDNAGYPYSIWWVIFNNPAACATMPCSAADLGVAAAKASVFNASGAISADNYLGGGVINVDFSTTGGNIADGVFFNPSASGADMGLARANGFRAEVHVVVVEHTPTTPADWIRDLTTPANGANHRVAIFLP